MRKLLNTVYITKESAYLKADGENLVCSVEGQNVNRIPLDNIENIVCFSYLGCSPKLMGKCVERGIPINFLSPGGKFLAKVFGETKGNVFLRTAQIDVFREGGLGLAQNEIAAKLCNTIKLIKGFMHNKPFLREDKDVSEVLKTLNEGIEKAFSCSSFESLLGIEGSCASSYFSIYGKFFSNPSSSAVKNADWKFEYRNRRPPLDPINAVLSFAYTLLTAEIGSSLETVGLDSYIGFFHTLRSGRRSLACDLAEEMRCIAERFTVSLFNLKQLNERDFERQISGAVYLNEDGKKKFLTNWQEKKRADIEHPHIKKKIPLGLLPYVQANLLAKFIRGDIKEYPCYILK